MNFPVVNNSDYRPLEQMQKKAQNLQLIELNPDECQKAYRSKLQTGYRNILAVSDNVSSNTSVVWVDRSFPMDGTPTRWMSQNAHELSSQNQDDSVEWSLGFYGVLSGGVNWTIGSYPISKCLVEETDVSCALKCDLRLLAIATAGVAIEIIAMTTTLLLYRHPALVTIGDAISSFLEEPDITTVDMCLATPYDFRTKMWRTGPRLYRRDMTSWIRSSAASKMQWAATGGM